MEVRLPQSLVHTSTSPRLVNNLNVFHLHSQPCILIAWFSSHGIDIGVSDATVSQVCNKFLWRENGEVLNATVWSQFFYCFTILIVCDCCSQHKCTLPKEVWVAVVSGICHPYMGNMVLKRGRVCLIYKFVWSIRLCWLLFLFRFFSDFQQDVSNDEFPAVEVMLIVHNTLIIVIGYPRFVGAD